MLESQINSLETQKENLEINCKELESNISKLEHIKIERKGVIKSMEDSIGNFTVEIKKKEDSLLNLQNKIQQSKILNEDLIQLQKQIDNKQLILNNLSQTIENSKKSNSPLLSDIEILSAKKEELEKTCRDLRRTSIAILRNEETDNLISCQDTANKIFKNDNDNDNDDDDSDICNDDNSSGQLSSAEFKINDELQKMKIIIL